MKAPVGSPREGNDAPKVDFAARLDALEFALSTLRGGARTLRWALSGLDFALTRYHAQATTARVADALARLPE